jgi:tRNA dimethylallyltransferase
LSGASDVADVGVICGPTAAGKSAIAMWIAERVPVTIVSADSRQIYRGFDIGTAKPSAADQTRVPHRGVDVAEPTVRYSAAAWCEKAGPWIDEARAGGRTPLVVGGTGLYLRALFDGLFREPSLDASRRQAVAAELSTIETSELRRWVERLDPPRARLGRTQLLRAVEIALLTGSRMSDLHRDRAGTPRWRARYLVVDPGPVLADRIAARIDDMLDHGWPDEVAELMHTVPEDAPAWNATGYDAVRRLVMGTATRAVVHEEILIATRQFAKRQRTWFRHQLPADRVTRVDPLAPDWTAVVTTWLGGASLPGERLA